MDWLTGRPLTYDIDHQDALIYLDAAGRERFLVVGSPNATGASDRAGAAPVPQRPGPRRSRHPDASTWTAAEALSPIAWLAGQPIHPAG